MTAMVSYSIGYNMYQNHMDEKFVFGPYPDYPLFHHPSSFHLTAQGGKSNVKRKQFLAIRVFPEKLELENIMGNHPVSQIKHNLI